MSTANPTTDPADGAPPRSPLARLAAAWDRFFFRPADPTTLGLMRLCAGLVALYTVVAFSLDLQALFGEHAWIDLQTRNEWRKEYPTVRMVWGWVAPPAPPPKNAKEAEHWKKMKERWGADGPAVYAEGNPIWSIWFHVTDPTAMACVHAATILVAFLFMIGFCTRVTSVLTWFTMLSYIHRSNFTIFGVDTMMSIALLYLMIGPSGAALSVDRLIARWWASSQALRRRGDKEPGEGPVRLPALPVAPSVSANLAYRLFQIHLCIIYMAAGLSKLQGTSWWTGEAVWGTLANFEFAPMQYGLYNAFLAFLCDNPFVWRAFVTAGTLFTLAFEIGFTFLIWQPRTRWVMILMAVILHGGIGLFMGLKTFSMMMLVLVLSFVAPDAIHRLLRGLGRGPRGLRLRFAGQDPRAVRRAALVHALDVWDQVELVETSGSGSGPRLELATPGGGVVTGRALAFRLLRVLGIFRVFYPTNWFQALKGSPAAPESSPTADARSPEPAGRRSGDLVKSGGPHVKAKR